LPSGENATEVTTLVCPSSVRCNAPVSLDQSRTVLSFEPEATSLPSGENATELTAPVCPSSVCKHWFQIVGVFGDKPIQLGISKVDRTTLVFGANTSADEYIWRGAF
jgi:hypothetical protein